MLKPWTFWTVLIGVLVAGEGFGWLLAAQGWHGAAQVVWWITRIFAAGWIVMGLLRWQANPWVRRLTAWIIGTIAAAILAGLCLSFGARQGAFAVTGIWAMALLFFGGMFLIRLVFRPGHPVFGVAHTLVDEAIRMKVPLIFLIILVLFVPVLPFVLDSKELLHYRIQSFLTWSMMAVSVLLSLMTIFLAVGTITNEIHGRQIFLTMTKPVSRGRYLLGKWLGIIALNLVLVAVCGGGIYVFTQLLARQQAINPVDREAVDHQVLVARASVKPVPASGTDLHAAFRQRLERLRATNPETYGQPGSPIDTLDPVLRNKIQQQVTAQWYSIPPRGATTYQFTNLSAARDEAQTVQLRIKPQPAAPTPQGFVYLGMEINGRPAGVRKLSESQFHVLNLPASAITAKGDLAITFHNVALANSQNPSQAREQSSISFNTDDGIELLYQVGGFEANLARGMFIIWLRLAALAMLGLLAGTYLGFPVACLLALVIYIAGAMSGYLTQSLQFYAAFPASGSGVWESIVWFPTNLWHTAVTQGEVWKAIQIVIRLIGSTFLTLIPKFGRYDATSMIADGRVVSNVLLGSAVLWTGVWTIVMAIIAWVIFRYRELARVTV